MGESRGENYWDQNSPHAKDWGKPTLENQVTVRRIAEKGGFQEPEDTLRKKKKKPLSGRAPSPNFVSCKEEWNQIHRGRLLRGTKKGGLNRALVQKKF